MSDYTVENLYEREEFHRGGSLRADEAIAAVLRVLYNVGERYSHIRFWRAWQELLAVVAEEFTALTTNNLASLRNLARLSLPLESKSLYDEALTIWLVQEAHVPSSCEVQSMLGGLYRLTNKLEEAAAHFTRAYDLAMQEVQLHEYGPSHPVRLDASDYLRYLADVEVKRNRCPQALVVAIRALNIIEQAGPTFEYKQCEAYNLLYRISLLMELDHLAETYRLKHIKLKGKYRE